MHTVLVVDDEASFLASIAEGLSSGDVPCHVLTACDGAAAIELLETKDVSIVMTDLKMPNVDGFQLLAWLATHRPSTPVVVMTAFGTPTMEDQVVDNGALHFIEKPFDVRAARRTIGRILETRDDVVTIALPDLIRMIMLERRTAIVHAGFDGTDGAVAVSDGRIVGARLGPMEDIVAAEAMRGANVSWFSLELKPAATADDLRAALGLLGPTTSMRLKEFLDDHEAAKAVNATVTDGAIEEMLARALELDGAVAASLMDVSRTAVLASHSTAKEIDIARGSASSVAAIRVKQQVLQGLGLEEPIEDCVMTATAHYHIVRMLKSRPDVALYVVLKRDTASLAYARMQMAEIDGVAA